MNNKEKKRNTKRKILSALNDLLVHRGIDDIKVTDICKKAEISRDTFYKHFADKYDVCGWKLGEDMSATIDRVLSIGSHYSNWRDFYLLIYENKRFYINAWSSTCYNSLYRYAYSYSIICSNKAFEQLPAERRTPLLKQFVDYSISASIAITGKWIETGMKTPPEIMAAIHICFLPEVNYEIQDEKVVFHDIRYCCDPTGAARLKAFEKLAKYDKHLKP